MVPYNIDVYLKHTEQEHMYVRELIELVTDDHNGNIFNFTIHESENIYDLTGKTVKLIVKSEKGTVIQENCTLVSAIAGTATITLPSDMFCEGGTYYAEVQIWKGTSRITTLPFDYSVRLSLENDGSVKADNRFSLLQQALEDVKDANVKANQAKTIAEGALTKAGQAVTTIDSKTQQVNTAVEDVNKLKTELEPLKDEITNKIVIYDTKPTTPAKNGFYMQNRDVIRDGLISYDYNKTLESEQKNINFNYTLPYTIQLIYNNVTAPTYLCMLKGYPLFIDMSVSKIQIGYFNSKMVVEYVQTDISKSLPHYDIVFLCNSDETIVGINGINFKVPAVVSGNGVIWYSPVTDGNISKGKCSIITYNRVLSPEEIKYNFDGQGKNRVQKVEKDDGTAYALSALAEDVFFKNGSNLERAMNQFVSWKTLTMGTDGAFPTTKVADWYSDRYKIQGNTVKNYGKGETVTAYGTDSNFEIQGSGSKKCKITKISNGSTGNEILVYFNDTKIDLPINQKLYLTFYITTNRKEISLRDNAVVTTEPYTYIPMSKLIDGLNVFEFNTNSNYTGAKVGKPHIYPSFDNWAVGDYMEVSVANLTDGKVNYPVDDVGLISVGTTADGKTCLSYSCNGVENQFELPHPLRKWDTLKNGVDVIGSNEITVDGVNTYKCIEFVELAKTLRIVVPINGGKYDSPCLCDKLVSIVNYTIDIEHLYGSADVIIMFLDKAKITYPYSVDNVNNYLKLNNYTVQYQLAQPTSVAVKSTFAYGPDSSGNADIRFTSPVLPAAAELKVAQTADQVTDRLTALENALLLMQSK